MGPQCAAMLLEWLKARATESAPNGVGPASQGTLWKSVPYEEEKPTLRSEAEFEGALEHLEYAVFRRFQNQLTRAERARMDNTIHNALFKIDRFLERHQGAERELLEARCRAVREAARDGRDRIERLRAQARRADLKLSQLDSLSPEGFEEFVAEVFEVLGYDVERVGGSGDEGVDLRVVREGLKCIVQCKYHKSQGVIGSPDLQKFLGTIHHTRSHKGFFVTTRTFSLAAERFVTDHPIELIDGPRLVELVQQAMGPGAAREPESALF
jgi:restriction system protein